MRALLPAIALCAGLQAGAAPQAVPRTAPGMTMAGQGELHAQLVTPRDGSAASQRHDAAVVVASTLQPAAAPAHSSDGSGDHQPTTPAMLLAALALMTGIALRRWGAGQQ